MCGRSKLLSFEVYDVKNGEINNNKCLNLCEFEFNVSKNQIELFCYINNSIIASYVVIITDIQILKVYGTRLLIITKLISFNIKFETDNSLSQFICNINNFINKNELFDNINEKSMFDKRTEKDSEHMYFNFYSQLGQQQNMMQDTVRTYTYYNAILQNHSDFKNKVVLDVGTGSGLLAFFAAQAGAKKVYAVEASDIAHFANILVKHNAYYSNIIQIIKGKIEEIELPELVDTIISEPIGYFLLNERMLESYLHAKKFLKPNGSLYPNCSILYFAPFSDDFIYSHIVSKSVFWSHKSFFGIDLSILEPDATNEYLSQPIIDIIDPKTLQSYPYEHMFDFKTLNETDLQEINIPFSMTCFLAGITHGLAFWFDAAFQGTNKDIWLSTAPNQPATHWYQVRCMFKNPINLRVGESLVGHVFMKANKKQSYYITIKAWVDKRPNILAESYVDLKMPYTIVGLQHGKPNVLEAPSSIFYGVNKN